MITCTIQLGTFDGRAIECTVDAVDYEWAMQWRWRYVRDKRGKKFYAVRNTRIRAEKKQISVFMHKAILKRKEPSPPSPEHIIGEHEDGNSLNNCRINLSWATPSENCKTARVRMTRCAKGLFTGGEAI